MKYILLSHDVDHIKPSEHFFNDLIIPKFIIRSKLELFLGKISMKEWWLRMKDILLNNQWHQVDNIISYHKNFNIPSTFFVGVNNGKGLSYSLADATLIIQQIIANNFDVGVHGISFNSEKGVQKEFQIFKEISKKEKFGIRMHYLRKDTKTLKYISNAGYLYDASVHAYTNPYLIDKQLIEIPLHIMDGWILNKDKRYQCVNLEIAKKYTLETIDILHKKNIDYISILFHDRYFSSSFATWKKWYEWLLNYLLNNNYKFISHTDLAISLLQKNESEKST
ncbi:MAG: hypothetical protein OHK0036_08170 [Bacteroidia bacterium]